MNKTIPRDVDSKHMIVSIKSVISESSKAYYVDFGDGKHWVAKKIVTVGMHWDGTGLCAVIPNWLASELNKK